MEACMSPASEPVEGSPIPGPLSESNIAANQASLVVKRQVARQLLQKVLAELKGRASPGDTSDEMYGLFGFRLGFDVRLDFARVPDQDYTIDIREDGGISAFFL